MKIVLIGAGGFGQPILTGIRLNDFGLIWLGAGPAAGLAGGPGADVTLERIDAHDPVDLDDPPVVDARDRLEPDPAHRFARSAERRAGDDRTVECL